MRNLLLLAAALGFAVPASAQNSASTNQSGSGNLANVNQTYVAGDVSTINQATVDQVGTTLDARVRQQGAGNAVTIDQSGARHIADAEELLGYSNSIDIVQTGGNAAAGTGGGNTVRATFRGDLNDVDILQSGDGNRINANAQAQQNDQNVLTLTQMGSDNEVDMRFKSNNDRNDITTFQDGTRNTLGLVGGPSDGIEFGNNTDDNFIDASQVGSMNDGNVIFANGSSFNTVMLDQNGTGHFADIMIDGMDNTSTVTQN